MSPSKRKEEPDACGILANLWRLVQAVLEESEPEMASLGLSPKTFFLLSEVDDHPFPAELARKMQLPPPTVTYMIKQLEERGLLARQAEPGDLRKFRLVRTNAGREALGRGTEKLGALLAERLARLDRADVLRFDKIVERLAEKPGSGPGA
jgi:DNA-binding MarR family transcriptional regulator